MDNLEFICNLRYINMDILIYILKLFFIAMCTYYTFLKIINTKRFINIKFIITTLATSIISLFCAVLKYKSDSFTSIICLIFLLSITYCKTIINKFGFSILITIVSLSINYILFFIAIIISFMPNVLFPIQNDYINLLLMVVIHIILLNFLFRLKKFKYGITFLQRNLENEYFDILILNINISILFLFILLNSLDLSLIIKISFPFIIYSIIAFIVIQKTLNMYYKHKLLVKEVEDTKKELEKKNEEIAGLEAENLNISKINHSISHKQKSLEHKLNKLILQSEISSELDISDEIKKLSDQCFNITTNIELPKTEIEQLDDMFSYMQNECSKNNITFELKLSGNIYQMINNFIDKSDLEILLADLIKNAIIAINHSDNVNRSILVKLGLIDRFYSLYVYDSGIEFEIDTLLNLGQKPSTTHVNDGGSGMGFMNIFDTLLQCKASILINEITPPCKENYTKCISIIFDKKSKYEINSYRSDKIEKVDNRKNLIIK